MKVYARGRRGAAAWGVVGAIAAMLAGEATATITVSRPDSGSLSYADGEQITGVSGRVSGADDVRVNAKDYEFTGAAGLVGLEWGEKSDEPCRIAHFSRDMNAANPDESRSYEDIDRCDGYGGGADKRVKLGGGAFVTGLRVCLNGGEDRVKGIQLKGRIVNEDGRLSNFDGQPSDSRSNCRDWQNWIECRDGMIAAGYIAYMSTGSNPDSLKGLKLVCRQPVFTAANDEIAFRGKVVTSERAGKGGAKTVDLLPGDQDVFSLRSIAWWERNDLPCKVTVMGEDLSAQPDRRNETHDGCGAEPRGGSKRAVPAEDFQLDKPITGLRACIRNDRLKGIEIEQSSVSVVDGEIRVNREPHEEDFVATQPNCDEGDFEWTDFVRCPAGKVAVGLRLHVADGQKPRAVKGLTLLCRGFL